MLIMRGQVEKYNNSQSAKLATDMFEKLKSETIHIMQTEYCCLGVSDNLQLKEFRVAKLVDKRW